MIHQMIGELARIGHDISWIIIDALLWVETRKLPPSSHRIDYEGI